jgi:hypothetical protein
MLASNGRLEDDKDLQAFQAENDLRDLHLNEPAPSTYIGLDTSCIGQMFGCNTVYQALKPTSCMQLRSTLAHKKSAIAPPAWVERAEMEEGGYTGAG